MPCVFQAGPSPCSVWNMEGLFSQSQQKVCRHWAGLHVLLHLLARLFHGPQRMQSRFKPSVSSCSLLTNQECREEHKFWQRHRSKVLVFAGLVFNERVQLCDWPENVSVPCGKAPAPRKIKTRRRRIKHKNEPGKGWQQEQSLTLTIWLGSDAGGAWLLFPNNLFLVWKIESFFTRIAQQGHLCQCTCRTKNFFLAACEPIWFACSSMPIKWNWTSMGTPPKLNFIKSVHFLEQRYLDFPIVCTCHDFNHLKLPQLCEERELINHEPPIYTAVKFHSECKLKLVMDFERQKRLERCW